MLKTLRLYTHLFLLKIASHLGVWLGTLIIRMKKPRTVDYRKLKTIYLNRSDRIGDAIISKPFMKILIEWLRENGCMAEIVIIASQYNYFLLKDMESAENNVRVIEEIKNLDAYESKLHGMIKKHVNFLYRTLAFRWTHGSHRNEKSLFLDMGGGDLVSILKYKELYNSVIAGSNIFWSSHILDIAIDHSYAHYAGKNLIESYIEVTEKIFWLPFRDFIYDRIDEFYDYDASNPKSGICLFVGVKVFRNLPVATWRRIIHCVAESFPEETITVLDDHTNVLYDLFIQESFPSNVIVEKNTYSLTDFTAHVSWFAFVAGIDGGGINMVKSLTNSCMVFTFAQHEVWSCFTGRHHYEEISGENNWHSGTAEIPPNGQQVSYIYKESVWLPTFNIDGNREMFRDFDMGLLNDIIRKALRK